MISQRDDIYLNTKSTAILYAAEFVVEEENAELNRIGFRYTSEFLAHPAAFPLDPKHLPLQATEFVLSSQ